MYFWWSRLTGFAWSDAAWPHGFGDIEATALLPKSLARTASQISSPAPRGSISTEHQVLRLLLWKAFNLSCSTTSFQFSTIRFHFPPLLCMNAFNQDVWMNLTLDEKPGGRPKQSITSLRRRTSLSPYFLSLSLRLDVLSGSQKFACSWYSAEGCSSLPKSSNSELLFEALGLRVL